MSRFVEQDGVTAESRPVQLLESQRAIWVAAVCPRIIGGVHWVVTPATVSIMPTWAGRTAAGDRFCSAADLPVAGQPSKPRRRHHSRAAVCIDGHDGAHYLCILWRAHLHGWQQDPKYLAGAGLLGITIRTSAFGASRNHIGFPTGRSQHRGFNRYAPLQVYSN